MPTARASIVALDPKGQSVENLNFNGYSTGAAANQLIQANNTYQITDTFSKVLGNHTLKFGAEFHADQVNAHAIAQFNGSFVFSGTETGVDFADFLIGVPSQYNQSQLNPFYARNKYVGAFAQDSWHVLANLTLNYGLRWDRVAPWSEKYNQISTFVAGAQSVVFPVRLRASFIPAISGVPNTLAPIRNRNFAPRVGLAWSPQAETGSLLGKFSALREPPASAPALAISTPRSTRSRSACWPRMRLMAPPTPALRRRCLQRHSSPRPTDRTMASRFHIPLPR